MQENRFWGVGIMRTRVISASIFKDTDLKINRRVKELGLKNKTEYVRWLLRNDLGDVEWLIW